MGDIDIDEESTSFVQAHVDEAYPLQVYHEDDAAGLESALVQGGNPKKKWQNWVKQHKEFHSNTSPKIIMRKEFLHQTRMK